MTREAYESLAKVQAYADRLSVLAAKAAAGGLDGPSYGDPTCVMEIFNIMDRLQDITSTWDGREFIEGFVAQQHTGFGLATLSQKASG